MIDLFLEHAPPRLACILEGIAAADASAVGHAAQSLTSTAANIGAADVSALSRQLESSADAADWPPIRSTATALEGCLGRSVDALTAYRRARSA
jgi:HPt (histidine-containing phosphotransfer) domain-containing protein